MKIAIYTCVTGGYDYARMPLVKEKDCDYYMISDNEALAGDSFNWIDVRAVCPAEITSPKDQNRYCKMHPHKIFPEYDFTVYMDGSIQIIRPVSHYINNVGSSGLAIHRHRERDCIYSEGIFLYWLGAVKKEALLKDISRYMDAKVPRHFGLFECGMIVTDLKNENAKQIYQCWYEEYQRGAKRDQQALIYVLWMLGMTCDDIGDLGGEYNILTNPDIKWSRSAHYK